MKKCILFLAMLLALCFVLTGCDSGSSGGDDPAPVAVESVSLDRDTLLLGVETDGTLTATVLPGNATDKSVTWSSGDETVATVDQNGKVTGKTIGTANITVTTNDGSKTASCVVTVLGEVCTVTFNANGGSGTMEDAVVEKGAEYTTPASTFTAPAFTAKTGAVPATHKNFAGWNTKTDGSGTAYAAGVAIPAVTADTTLYAQWAKPVFTVGKGTDGIVGTADDKKVYFAQGNLYWDGSSFKMESTQSATIPTSDGLWSENHVSHFFWNKTANRTYVTEFTPDGGTTDDVFFTNDPSDVEKANMSFTVDGISGMYRILSVDEYECLLGKSTSNPGTNCRTASTIGGTENARYAIVKVNGRVGLIIFPDVFSWTSDMGTAPTNCNAKTSLTDAPTYTLAQFAVMESAGVVFLPYAGYRYYMEEGMSFSEDEDGKHIRFMNERGAYWASSHTMYWDGAYLLSCGGSIYSASYESRGSGSSVRLVCDYNED